MLNILAASRLACQNLLLKLLFSLSDGAKPPTADFPLIVTSYEILIADAKFLGKVCVRVLVCVRVISPFHFKYS